MAIKHALPPTESAFVQRTRPLRLPLKGGVIAYPASDGMTLKGGIIFKIAHAGMTDADAQAYSVYPASRVNRARLRFVSSPKFSNIRVVACLLPSTAG